MKLGIAVVYLVSERNERLLDLHLSQIETNTTVPYTIYACANRLLPRFCERLQRTAAVKICPCQTYEPGSGLLRQDEANIPRLGAVAVGSKYEHSFYLEQLIRTAIDDGVTHMAMLHVDSFPVRPGWAAELAAKLSDQCPLAGVVRDPELDRKPLTAGILFTRDFYTRYQPRLLLSQAEVDSEDYQRYRDACPHVWDSGYGYGFKLFVEGCTWHPLVRSNKGATHGLFASIHGDLIFHLHAAAFVERTKTVGFTKSSDRPTDSRRLGVSLARAVLPTGLRRKLRKSLPQRIRDPQDYMDRQAWEQERKRLFEDPSAYLTYLRTGVR